MQLEISDKVINNLPYVQLKISSDFKLEIWNQIKNAIKIKQNSSFKEESSNLIVCEWYGLLQFFGTLKDYCILYKIKVVYSPEAKKFLNETIRNSKRVAAGVSEINLGNNVNQKLKDLGFNKISLEDYQIRDLKRLLSLPHGANFSVQGSGKTAITLSLHTLLREKKNVNSLIVICPRNAFLAWEEELEYLLDSSTDLKKEGITELKGNYDKIYNLLNSGKRNFIVNYEKLVNITNLIGQFVLNPSNKVHLVLDESHKVKNEMAQRTEATQSLSTLPVVRKDILTGTPMPKQISDLFPQFKFLYPYEKPEKFINVGNQFYVRTTKNELKLPVPKREFIQVEMSSPQKALYELTVGRLMNQIKGITKIDKESFRNVRKSIVRLIMISSNPILLTNKMIEKGEFYLGDSIPAKVHLQLQTELQEGGSPKIREACNIARALAKEGKKTVIWSYFRNNIEYLGKYALRDLGAEFIHGGVNTGSEDEFDTRKWKIKRFKDLKSDCKVLVANYASCAEGISLHKVCHDAVYVDRSFQADQYLQSEDRISRLGNNDPKNIYILESLIPRHLRNIDYAIKINLQRKIDNMGQFLDDPRLIQMAMDETSGEMPIDEDTTIESINEILKDLMDSNV